MNAAIKLLFTTVVFLTIFNSTTFGNTKMWDVAQAQWAKNLKN